MSFLNRSLRSRIFLSMILLVIGASILIVVVTVFQYRENTQDYHRERLIRKETAIRENIDYVIPVPLHRKKLRKRGYNQVSAFGKRLAHHLNAEFLENALIKTANTKTQTKKGRISRWQNNKALYLLNDPKLLQHKNILLVDDVITTGATMEICAKTLNEAKGVTLYITSMAVVPLTQ